MGLLFQPGSCLPGGYVIEWRIGQGGMGVVYAAHHLQRAGSRVAIKRVALGTSDPEEQRQLVRRLKKEAEILSALHHPNLVGVLEWLDLEGDSCLVMEFVNGVTLGRLIEHAPSTPDLGQVLLWGDQIADALEYLHGQTPPVIMRDIKPANIMLESTPSGPRVRVLDFGLARVLGEHSHTTTFIQGAGTVGFAPIEQLTTGDTDARSDLYALGATLYALSTQTQPPLSLARRVGGDRMTPPCKINPAIPASMQSAILRMMAVHPDDRFRTAQEARAALRQCVPPVDSGLRIALVPCPQCGSATIAGVGACEVCQDGR